MVETTESASPEPPPLPEAAPPTDLGLRGFQVLSRHEPANSGSHDATPDDAVRAELAARAARFVQSVDEALVLSDDGAIRWLGDPVARLAAGDGILAPKAIVLADDAVTDDQRAAIQARVDAWIAAHLRKTLGALFELDALQSDNAATKAIAEALTKGFGVVERKHVLAQVRSLDQPARAALREKGVRFGAYTIFAPALLRPGPRKLAARLWELTHPQAGPHPGRDKLASAASSGRTSIPLEPDASEAECLVFGYRKAGDRAIRIDILERLADLIRADTAAGIYGAIVRSEPGDNGAAEFKPQRMVGFLVTPRMTSLTGCSHEQLAAVLRSLGYESVEVLMMDRPPPPPTAPTAEAAASAAALPERQSPDGSPPDVNARGEPVATDAAVESGPSEDAAAQADEAGPAAHSAPSTEGESVEQVEAEVSREPPTDSDAPQADFLAQSSRNEADSVLPEAPPEPAQIDAVNVEPKIVVLWRLAPPPPRRPRKPQRQPRVWEINVREPPRRPHKEGQAPPAQTPPPNPAPAESPPAQAAAPPAQAAQPAGTPEPASARKRAETSPPKSGKGPPPERMSSGRFKRPEIDKDSPFYKLSALKEALTRKAGEET